LSILADRQWGILHRPIDLAMRDTLTNQNNETDDGDERVNGGVRAKIGLIPH
jgi:hypothetical protein